MTQTDVILTDARREVLAGTYDGAANVERTHESNIRDRSNAALRELIEVANSETVDNEKIFDPRLVRALLTSLVFHGGLSDSDRDGLQHVSDAYRNALYFEVNQFVRNLEQEGRR